MKKFTGTRASAPMESYGPAAERYAKERELGVRALKIHAEKLKMLRSGMPASGANHWVAGELFDAIRSLGLLDTEVAP